MKGNEQHRTQNLIELLRHSDDLEDDIGFIFSCLAALSGVPSGKQE